MCDTVFGNNIVNIHARSGDRCAIIQICNDSGNGSLCRGRRERKNRASSFGERGTANEVHLTANTRNLLGADTLGRDLAHQIYLHTRMDGNQIFILTNDDGMIHIVKG